MPIAEAFASDARTVTALTRNAQPHQLSFEEQPIDFYVSGKTQETLYRIQGSHGKSLELTSQHPLVDEYGQVVTAATVFPGQKLLLDSGKTTTIETVEPFWFEGIVWNVHPESTHPKENVLVAADFLTGSGTIQNKQAYEEEYRFFLRKNADPSLLD